MSKSQMPFEAEVFIRDAYAFLENPSFLVQAANVIGKPAELFAKKLPARHQKLVNAASQAALKKALVFVTKTIPQNKTDESFRTGSRRSKRDGLKHAIASFGSGTVGGLLGLPALPLELPITTAIMLRSIAASARKFGFDLNDPEVQMDCLYVLSLGSAKSDKDDEMSSSYWTSRAAFSKLINDAAGFLATRATARQAKLQSSPVLTRFLARIATRFEVVVSEKLMAQGIPLIGALGGGAINAMFTDYFSDAARYHFGLKALERDYGTDAVKRAYRLSRRQVS